MPTLLYAMAGRRALVVLDFGLSLVAYLVLAFLVAFVLLFPVTETRPVATVRPGSINSALSSVVGCGMPPRLGDFTEVITPGLPRPRSDETRERERYFEYITRVRESLRTGDSVQVRRGKAAG